MMSRRRSTRVSVALVALATALPGCSDESCGNQAYSDIIDVQFEPRLTERSSVVIEFESDPVSGSCEVDVGTHELMPCSNAHLSILGQNQAGIVELSSLRAWFYYAPSTITLTISKNGTKVFDETITPHYVTEAVNRKGCDLRRHATETIAVN